MCSSLLCYTTSACKWKEKKHMKFVTLSLFPVKFEWNGDIRTFTGAAKYETNLNAGSKDLCGVVHQIIDVEIDNVSHVFLLNGSLI